MLYCIVLYCTCILCCTVSANKDSYNIVSLTIRVYLHSFSRCRSAKSAKSREMPRKFGYIAVVDHPRSSILVSNFLWGIVTMDVSLTVFEILTHKARKWLFPNPHLVWRLAQREPVRVSGWNLTRKNQSDGATVWWKFHNINFTRFWLIHPCDRQTDGRAMEYSVCCRALKMLHQERGLVFFFASQLSTFRQTLKSEDLLFWSSF